MSVRDSNTYQYIRRYHELGVKLHRVHDALDNTIGDTTDVDGLPTVSGTMLSILHYELLRAELLDGPVLAAAAFNHVYAEQTDCLVEDTGVWN